MLAAMLAVLLQARSAEERLRELELKLSALEQRQKALEDEKARLEKQAASAWVKRYASTAAFSETQAVEIEALWFGWLREGVDAPSWPAREAALRAKLTPEQASKVARAVREEQEKGLRRSIAAFTQAAKLAPERVPAFEKLVLAKLPLAEGVLLPQAHPEAQIPWLRIHGAVEASLPEATLEAAERAALAEALARWKPK